MNNQSVESLNSHATSLATEGVCTRRAAAITPSDKKQMSWKPKVAPQGMQKTPFYSHLLSQSDSDDWDAFPASHAEQDRARSLHHFGDLSKITPAAVLAEINDLREQNPELDP